MAIITPNALHAEEEVEALGAGHEHGGEGPAAVADRHHGGWARLGWQPPDEGWGSDRFGGERVGQARQVPSMGGVSPRITSISAPDARPDHRSA